jgi:acylphosphatase
VSREEISGVRRLTARVTGQVQGVGFRQFTRQEARRLGLRGTVRNRPDGSVEVVAEGVEAQLRELLVRLRRGPAAASVAEVEAGWAAASGEYRSFEIGY